MRSHRAIAREGPLEPDAAVTRRLREADAQERREALIADCMQAKGYSRAPETAGRGT
jgi:hypothetical protein